MGKKGRFFPKDPEMGIETIYKIHLMALKIERK